MKRGQSSLEYMVLMVVVIGSLIAVGVYMKRGIQGRWKENTGEDSMLYDPRTGHSHTVHSLIANSYEETITVPVIGEKAFATTSYSQSHSIERTKGNIENGGY